MTDVASSEAPPGASGPKRHDIFISYASPDKAAADAVCAALEEAGFKCWIAPRDTDAGAYSRSIIESIRAARMLVLILSPHSDASPNVLSEVAEAFDRKVALLPFRLSEFPISDDLRFFIRTHHWIDAFPGAIDPHVSRLVERAHGRLAGGAEVKPDRDLRGEGGKPFDTAALTKRPARRGRGWRFVAGAALSVAIGIGGYFAYDSWRQREEQASWEAARVAVVEAIQKARAATETGSFDEAFDHVDRAAAIDPESVSLDDARRALIDAMIARGDAALRRRRALDRIDRARDAIRRRDYGKAQRLFDDAERLDGRAADFRMLRAGLPANMRESLVEAERRAAEEARAQEAERRRRAEEQRRVEIERERAAKPSPDDRPRLQREDKPRDDARPSPPAPPGNPAIAPPTLPAAGTPIQDCDECPKLIVVPAGQFQMGSPDSEREHEVNEGPVRTVTIAKPFAMGVYAVTFAEMDACTVAGACTRLNDNGWGRGRQPAISVSWDDARAYLDWLSKKTGKAYRLPTEAEWEYAARSRSSSRYFWGDAIGRNQANCAGCGSRWDGKQPAPVGSFAANAFGLHEMHGNVWQWVADCWHASYQGAPADGSEWAGNGECARRVLRGGAFFSYPKSLRAAYRYAYEPRGRLGNIGFRAARDIP